MKKKQPEPWSIMTTKLADEVSRLHVRLITAQPAMLATKAARQLEKARDGLQKAAQYMRAGK